MENHALDKAGGRSAQVSRRHEFSPLLLVVDELGGLWRLQREALALPDLLDEGCEHVRGHRLPELEVGVPDGAPRGRAPHDLAEVERLRGRHLSLYYSEHLSLLDVDQLAPLPADDPRDGAYLVNWPLDL